MCWGGASGIPIGWRKEEGLRAGAHSSAYLATRKKYKCSAKDIHGLRAGAHSSAYMVIYLNAVGRVGADDDVIQRNA